MATLVLKSLTCVSPTTFFGDDDIKIKVNGDSVWEKSMESDQTRSISSVQVDFEGEVTVKLLDVDADGDESLGAVTIGEDKAGSDGVAKFEKLVAEYHLSYRVDATMEVVEDEEWFDQLPEGEEDEDGFSWEDYDEATWDALDEGPTGDGAPDEPVEPCPLGTLTVRAISDEGGLIAGALVVVTPNGFAAPTNFDGTVGPVQLPDGPYTIEVSKEPYLPRPLTAVVVMVAGAEITVDATLTAPKTGVSIQTGEVACPGHKHEVKAVANPPGGTFDWTVESGSARLVDSSGNPTTTGDTVYLQGLDPQEVELSVKYTKDWREATDSKTIKIHKVSFAVSNFQVQRGQSWAHERAGGLEIDSAVGKATFAMDPKVTIHLEGGCPRPSDCAQNFQVGWLQTVRDNDCEALYPSTRVSDTIPLPIRDAVPPDSQPPFYDGGAVMTFFNDGDRYTVHLEDSPHVGPRPWSDPRPGVAGAIDLESVAMKNSFTSWLAAQNIEWANDVSRSDALIYLKHVNWRCGMKVPVDIGQAVGSRAGKRSERARFWGRGDGQGGSAPDLNAPIANTSNVYAENPR